jgi:hypothetical protein
MVANDWWKSIKSLAQCAKQAAAPGDCPLFRSDALVCSISHCIDASGNEFSFELL